MRQLFFIGILVGSGLALLGYFGWLVLRALYSVFEDWQMGRELNEIEADTAERHKQIATANAARLNNGCDHDFELGPGALPRRVCRKCGLEAEKPTENCDHIWHRSNEDVPISYCEKCGKEISGSIGIVEPVS